MSIISRFYFSQHDSITTDNPLPRWYLMLDGERIIGSFGLIENDFMLRKDLKPWLCALYIEESERGKTLGSKLLTYGSKQKHLALIMFIYVLTTLAITRNMAGAFLGLRIANVAKRHVFIKFQAEILDFHRTID